MKSFPKPVTISDGEAGSREIADLGEAIEFLRSWPQNRRGPIHGTAMRACDAAYIGLVSPEGARSAFAAFARSVGLLRPDRPAVEPWMLPAEAAEPRTLAA